MHCSVRAQQGVAKTTREAIDRLPAITLIDSNETFDNFPVGSIKRRFYRFLFDKSLKKKKNTMVSKWVGSLGL